MALDPVPTWIHGAKHSGDLLRQGDFNKTNGSEGVSSSTAFQVRATPTPSNQVRVAPGGLLMLSPFDEGQTYSMRNASETLVTVPESSSLSAKTWYINAWVNDPNKPGGIVPVSKEFGPYNFLTCDPEPKTDFPHYAPAKIVVPKSTAVITQDMITDLRELAQPKRDGVVFARPRIMADNGEQAKLTSRLFRDGDSSRGELFPGGAGFSNEASLYVPDYTTRMSVRADWMGIIVAGGVNSHGRYWVEFGDQYKVHTWPNGRQYEYSTQQFGFDTSGAGSAYTTNWSLMDTVYVHPKLRGKIVTFAFKAGLNDSASSAGISMGALGGLGIDLTFAQVAVDADTV